MTAELPRVVVDTNIWISALVTPAGAPAAVLQAFRQRRFIPVIADTLLEEIRDVLARPRILRRRELTDDRADELLDLLQARGIPVRPAGQLQICRDPKDDYLLEAALLGSAQLLVTRDDDLKRDLDLMAYLQERGIQVLSVAQFLAYLDAIPPTEEATS